MAKFVGSGIADVIGGGSGDDLIVGRGGDDALSGGNGSDTLLGNKGNDFLKGQGGNDFLFGGAGDDILWGGSGNDYLSGDKGFDEIAAFRGANTIVFNIRDNQFTDGADTINKFDLVADGGDKLLLNGGIAFDVFMFQSGEDTIVTYGEDLMATLVDHTYSGNVFDYFDFPLDIKEGDLLL